MLLLGLLCCSCIFLLADAGRPLIIPDPAQEEFEFHFHLEWKLTMAVFDPKTNLGTVIKYDPDQQKYVARVSDQHYACNATAEPPEWADLVAMPKADGKHRRMVMINGELPGPTVVVPYGARVVVRVANRLDMEGLSIHFHGMDKRDAWFMDGVARVQQCPISAGSDFVYRFVADTPGTHFYHGHLGSDRSEGVFGGVVVMPQDRSVRLSDDRRLTPDVEYSLVLYDWNSVGGSDLWFNHVWRTMKFLYGYENEVDCWRPNRMVDGTMLGGAYPFSGIIVNTKGWYDQGDILQRPWTLDLETYEMEAGGKAYLFRMVNAGQSLGLMVSVEGHRLQVVATDGAPVRGVETDFVLLFPGERYDFLIIAKEKPDRPFYYMIVETLDYVDYFWQRTQPFYGLARIQYSNETTYHKPKPDIAHSRCTEDSKCVVVNCPFPDWPREFNRTCFNVETMVYEGEPETEVLKPSFDNDTAYEEYFLNLHYDNVMNGWLFKYPKAPPYFYNQNESKVVYSCTEDNWNGVRNSWCTYTLNITLNNVVQMTLYNAGQGSEMMDGFHHPVHLHGTHFHVVKVGYGQYNETTGFITDDNDDFPCKSAQDQCDHLEWANKTWLNGNVPGMNLDRPVFKDTVVLPAGGYVVLRFKADNPGWWVMHCHIMVHHMGGMATAIRVGTHEQMPSPPPNFPRGCGVYDPADDEDMGTTTRSTSGGASGSVAASYALLFVCLVGLAQMFMASK